MIRVYVSLPIGNYEKTVKSRYNDAVSRIKERFPNAEIVGPINIDEFDDNGIKTERTHPWEWYMGEDIKELLTCTHIFMCQGWRYSRGCRDEKGIAEADGLQVIFHPWAFMKLENPDS